MNFDEAIKNVDKYFDDQNFEESIKLLRTIDNQESFDVKFRLARGIFKFVTTTNVATKRKKELINEAYQVANEAYALNKQHCEIHVWLAVIMDAKADMDGLKTRINELHNVRQLMEKAIEIDPENIAALHALGEFDFGVAELPWVAKKLLKTLFPSVPKVSYEGALKCFERAESLRPNYYLMLTIRIGMCYSKLGNKEQAKEWLTKASQKEAKNLEEETNQAEAIKILKTL